MKKNQMRNIVNKKFKSNFHILTPQLDVDLPEEIVADANQVSGHLPTVPQKREKVPDSPYMLRQHRISSYRNLDGNYQQYQKDMKAALEKSSAECKEVDLSCLNKLLEERDLHVVGVPGDGNCFFSAVAHQIFGDLSRHQEIRERAVNHIASNPGDFKDFAEDGDLDKFLSLNSNDREWADHLSIQATADAFQITIEIINSNQEQFGTRFLTPRNCHKPRRHIVLGHVEQLHYLSTELAIPFSLPNWGGFSPQHKKHLRNTCTLDGPLVWLMFSLYQYPKLLDLVKTCELSHILEVYELFLMGKVCEGKIQWYTEMAGLELPITENSKYIDFYGSEAEQCFEPLMKTDLAHISCEQRCSNENCQVNKKRRKICQIKIKNNFGNLSSRIDSSLEASNELCLDCHPRTGIVTRSVSSLPAFLIFPGDYLHYGDSIETILNLNLAGAAITYILVFISIKKACNHFMCIFRQNSYLWIQYDGLTKPLIQFKNKLDSVKFDKVGFFVYLKSLYLSENNDFQHEIIRDENYKNRPCEDIRYGKLSSDSEDDEIVIDISDLSVAMESKEVMKGNKEPVNLPTEVQNLLNDYDEWEAEIEREELKIRKKEMEKLKNIDKERFRRFMNMNEQKIIMLLKTSVCKPTSAFTTDDAENELLSKYWEFEIANDMYNSFIRKSSSIKTVLREFTMSEASATLSHVFCLIMDDFILKDSKK